ncbi:MAG: hypothetical protein KC777_06000 [Cyanobacteria bacterium HKST-UBA02]|nr:hypothetical protein [Cyanobacteria bacterium HKST-UBA02]
MTTKFEKFDLLDILELELKGIGMLIDELIGNYAGMTNEERLGEVAHVFDALNRHLTTQKRVIKCLEGSSVSDEMLAEIRRRCGKIDDLEHSMVMSHVDETAFIHDLVELRDRLRDFARCESGKVFKAMRMKLTGAEKNMVEKQITRELVG